MAKGIGNVDISQSQFLGYTYERLLKREAILTETIRDEDALDIEIEEAASLRKEVRACKAVFDEFNVEDPEASAADIIEVVTGMSIEAWQKQTGGGVLAQDLWSKTATITKKTTEGTKKGINAFGQWIVNKTQTQGGN